GTLVCRTGLSLLWILDRLVALSGDSGRHLATLAVAGKRWGSEPTPGQAGGFAIGRGGAGDRRRAYSDQCPCPAGRRPVCVLARRGVVRVVARSRAALARLGSGYRTRHGAGRRT